jgi:hypothetical protein
MTLGDRLAAATIELPGTETTATPDGGLVWSRGTRPFASASADGSIAEFGLDPVVADAACRTPDVAPSGRGSGWISLAPVELDEQTVDRAVAWLASAYRRVEPRN